MKRWTMFLLITFCICILASLVFGQINTPSSIRQMDRRIPDRAETPQKCSFRALISWSTYEDKSPDLRTLNVKVYGKPNSGATFNDYRFLSVNLSKLAPGNAENATTGQIYQSQFEWEEFISPAVSQHLAKNDFAEFSISLDKLKWKDALSGALYYMPAREVSPGNYSVFIRFEKNLGPKTANSCDIYSNELPISKDELIGNK